MGIPMIAGSKLSRNDFLFAVACALAYAAVALLTPSYTPLIEPDSKAYIEFGSFRPSLYPAFLYVCRSIGLGLVEITWLQLAIFSAALIYFLIVLMRVGFPKWLLAIAVFVFAGNVLFSSFHRSILTESLYFSITLMAVALWTEYFRTANMKFLMGAGLALGFMVGIRLAGLGLLPMQVIAVWLGKRPSRGLAVSILLAIVPMGIGAGGERLLYYAVHGSQTSSQAPNLLFGKAAMLVRPDMKFTGQYAGALGSLATELFAIYGPAQRYVENAPSLGISVQLSAIYEGYAQYTLLTDELAAAAKQERTSEGQLRTALGRQVILQNPLGYLRLTFLNNVGQWSVAAQKFPPLSRAIAAYADANPGVMLGGRIPDAVLHPAPWRVALLIYPAFLVSGAVTFILACGLLVFLARPALAETPEGFYWQIATFLSATCHGYTLFISLVNEWTPRFLMAVFPQLVVIALCMMMVAMLRVRHLALGRTVGLR